MLPHIHAIAKTLHRGIGDVKRQPLKLRGRLWKVKWMGCLHLQHFSLQTKFTLKIGKFLKRDEKEKSLPQRILMLNNKNAISFLHFLAFIHLRIPFIVQTHLLIPVKKARRRVQLVTRGGGDTYKKTWLIDTI